MMRTQGKSRVWLGLVFAFILVSRSPAIMFVSTGDPSHNTTAPTGSLTNSGWQYEGQWYVWLGTPIAPTFFLTAHHVNGNLGDPFFLNGVSYTTVALFDDPSSDLRIWQVAETFPYYAPLYTGTNEVGKACMVFGRGTDRGAAVIVGTKTNGWQWGNTNNIERWGQNSVSEITTAAVTDLHPGEQMLTTSFQANGMTNECGLSINDSGGGVFVQDGGSTGTWKLAGINYETDDAFVSTNGVAGSGFNATLTDYFHLFLQGGAGGTNWVQFTQHYAAQFYSTRVSARISWINSII